MGVMEDSYLLIITKYSIGLLLKSTEKKKKGWHEDKDCVGFQSVCPCYLVLYSCGITVVCQRITFHVYDLAVEGVGHQWSFLVLLEKVGILW